MKKGYLAVLLPFFIVWTTFGVAVNITGTVLKTGGGPLKDVAVSLAGVSGVSAKTDSLGQFTLLSATRVINVNGLKPMPLKFGIRGRDLAFYSVSGKISGNVTVFSAHGRQIVSQDFSDLMPLTQRVTLPLFAPGLTILRIIVNNKTYTCSIVKVSNAVFLKASGSTAMENIRPATLAAYLIADTVVAQKSWYSDKKTAIQSYTLSNITIYMDSIAPCNDTTLKDAGTCNSHKMLIGVAISPTTLNDPVAAREFDYVTPENEMKWQNTEASEGVYTFTLADSIVRWAQRNGIKVKGHCLVWYNQLPSWVINAQGRTRLLGIMKKHIDTLIGHFGNNVQSWDVVNEAFLTDNKDGSGNARMRDSVFYNQIGPDYIDSAYIYARTYLNTLNLKDIKLNYNEVSIDADNDKSQFARTTIRDWIDRGVPIDAIGFEMHLGPAYNVPTADMVKDNMQYYADLGLDVLISEWDINLCGGIISQQQQLQLYHDITSVCVNQLKCSAITIWGINDTDSWINNWSGSLCNGANSHALLFSNDQKKNTYFQVLNALNGN